MRFPKGLKMTQRQEKILNKIIKEYIRTARPVGSDFLEQKYRLDICPATIRNEMKELTKTGYLFQPHTSAGRIPTSRAYRFFVDSVLEECENKDLKNFSKSRKTAKNPFFQKKRNTEERGADSVKFFIKNLAEQSSGLAFVYFLKNNIFITEGWTVVFKNPEFKEKEFLQDFLEQFEILEGKMKDVFDMIENENFDICIGKEKSILDSENLSLILSKNPVRERLFGILGPSRMPYEKNIILINSLTEELEKFNYE